MGNTASALNERTATHCLVDRQTGQRVGEPQPLTRGLRLWFFYRTSLGRLLLSLPPTWWFLAWQHRAMAMYANSSFSKRDIPAYIKMYAIDAGAAEKPLEQYGSLQEFFSRLLKPGLRPVAAPGDDTVAVQPADSRVVVYDNVDLARRFWIKGRKMTVPGMLGLPPGSASPWDSCAILISRLCPADYHRLHAAVSGRVTAVHSHGHHWFGAEYAATHSPFNVLTENERLVVELETEEFGPVAQVMIGASEVGSVLPSVKVGQQVVKGQEVAMFAFGGSIMTTLFVSGSITFDEDLAAHTARGCETRVNMGTSLGRATGAWRCGLPPAGAAAVTGAAADGSDREGAAAAKKRR